MIKEFENPKVIAIIGNSNEAKSNLVYYLIEELKKKYKFKLVTYGLRKEIKGASKIFSINEIEQIRNSVIFIDEFFTLFDLEDRKKRKQIENTIRLIFHNNNVLVLVGLCENFKKFISAKINSVFYKKCTFNDFINGSSVKKSILNYQGNERGSEVLNLKKDEVILFNGSYTKYNIPYMKSYDIKSLNEKILIKKCGKNVPKKVNKSNLKVITKI